MSLDEDAIAAIENGSHEAEPDMRSCFHCAETSEHVEWHLVEYVGGSHWVCGACADGEI